VDGAVGLLAHGGELIEPEDSFEDGGAVGSAGLEQRLEAALGQDDGAQEGVVVEAKQTLDLGSDGPGVVEVDGRVVQATELVAALGAGARRRAKHPPAAAVGQEGQLGLHHADAVGDKRHHRAVIPGAAAIEGEKQPFEDRRLAGAGIADDRHELGVGEVDGLLGAVAAEAGHAQRERPHLRVSFRRALAIIALTGPGRLGTGWVGDPA
jgi:hypothetical protein